MLPLAGCWRPAVVPYVWKGVKPHPGLHGIIPNGLGHCHIGCVLAAVHAMNAMDASGRQAAWSVSCRMETPDLVGVVKTFAAAAFWNVLADFAVSAVVPRAAHTRQLTNPFSRFLCGLWWL